MVGFFGDDFPPSDLCASGPHRTKGCSVCQLPSRGRKCCLFEVTRLRISTKGHIVCVIWWEFKVEEKFAKLTLSSHLLCSRLPLQQACNHSAETSYAVRFRVCNGPFYCLQLGSRMVLDIQDSHLKFALNFSNWKKSVNKTGCTTLNKIIALTNFVITQVSVCKT